MTYRFSACPGCGGKLRTDAEQRTQHAEPPCTWFVHVDAEAAAIVDAVATLPKGEAARAALDLAELVAGREAEALRRRGKL